MLFNQLPLIKLGVQIVAGLGTSKILSDIVKNNVVVTTTAEAIMVRTGGFVLGSMLWDQTSKHIDATADNLVAWYEGRKEEAPTQ